MKQQGGHAIGQMCVRGGYLMDMGKLVMVAQVRIKRSKENLKDVEEIMNYPHEENYY